MPSQRSAGQNGGRVGADAFQELSQRLVFFEEALRLQEQRAATALQEVERKLREKDDAISALQRRLRETQERLAAVEERATASGGSGGGGGLQRLKGRVVKVEASLQSALQTFFPRVEDVLRQIEKNQSTRTRAFLATAASHSAASAREAPVTGGAAAGGGEGPISSEVFPAPISSSPSTCTSSGDGHQGAAADGEERERRRVALRLEVPLRSVEARTSSSPIEEELCDAARKGRLTDVRRFLDSGANINCTDEDGITPLLWAVWKAHAGVVSLLLREGADANAVDCHGNPALYLAAWSDRKGRCVELLVGAGADVNATDVDGVTSLHRAANWNNKEAVRALLAVGARRDLKPWRGHWRNKTPYDVARSPAVQDLLRV